MGCSESWPFRFNIIRCVGTQHIWTWSGVTERKGRTILFLPVKPRNLGARGLRQKVRESARPTFAREISTIENGAGIQNSRNENAVISLSALWRTSLDVASHTNEYSYFRIFRIFRIDGVCVLSKTRVRFKMLKIGLNLVFVFFLNFILWY